eukprot:scpid38316/ scgid8572/ Trafficking kinesin-binding protein 2; Amyotrophic lateral sclerosis 2 chromosomal region candidate gene 3 protein
MYSPHGLPAAARPVSGSSDENGFAGDESAEVYDAYSDPATVLLSDSQHRRIVQWTNSLQQPQAVGSGDVSHPPAVSSSSTDWDGRSDSSGAMLLDALQELDSVQLAQLYLRASEAAEQAEAHASSVVAHQDGGAEHHHHDTSGGGGELSNSANISSAELADRIAEHLRRRDKELELAARAGQELLQRNAMLAQDLSMTAAERDALEQQSAQLRHDIAGKEQLLRMYMMELNEIQDSIENSPAPVQQARRHRVTSPPPPLQAIVSGTELSVGNSDDPQLAQHIKDMQQQAREMEERERELIAECVRQVKDTADDVRVLHAKTSEREMLASEHASELARLREQNARLEESHKELIMEKQDLQGVLCDTRSKQDQLASQVSDLQSQYIECVSLFREASKELSMYRRHGSYGRLHELACPEEGEPPPPSAQQQSRRVREDDSGGAAAHTSGESTPPAVSLSQEIKTATRHAVADHTKSDTVTSSTSESSSATMLQQESGGVVAEDSRVQDHVTPTGTASASKDVPERSSSAECGVSKLVAGGASSQQCLQQQVVDSTQNVKPARDQLRTSSSQQQQQQYRQHHQPRTPQQRHSRTPRHGDASTALKAASLLKEHAERVSSHSSSLSSSSAGTAGVASETQPPLPPVTPAPPRLVLRTPLLLKTAKRQNGGGAVGLSAALPGADKPQRQIVTATPANTPTPSSPALPSSAERARAHAPSPSRPPQQQPSQAQSRVSPTSGRTKPAGPAAAASVQASSTSPSTVRRRAGPMMPPRASGFGRAAVQMVKPMEGSMTLLKWHLLAMQQQQQTSDSLTGGQSMPGIHIKTTTNTQQQQQSGSGGDDSGGTNSPRSSTSPGGGGSPVAPSPHRHSPQFSGATSPAARKPSDGVSSAEDRNVAVVSSTSPSGAVKPAASTFAAGRRIVRRTGAAMSVSGGAPGLGGLLDAV